MGGGEGGCGGLSELRAIADEMSGRMSRDRSWRRLSRLQRAVLLSAARVDTRGRLHDGGFAELTELQRGEVLRRSRVLLGAVRGFLGE